MGRGQRVANKTHVGTPDQNSQPASFFTRLFTSGRTDGVNMLSLLHIQPSVMVPRSVFVPFSFLPHFLPPLFYAAYTRCQNPMMPPKATQVTIRDPPPNESQFDWLSKHDILPSHFALCWGLPTQWQGHDFRTKITGQGNSNGIIRAMESRPKM